MIAVKLMGGLGNQMFQYALGRSISDKNNSKLVLDLSFYNDQSDVETPRQYELDSFVLNTPIIKKQILDKKPRINLAFRNNYFPFKYVEAGFPFNKEVFNQPDGTLYQGYWQTEKYFSGIRKKLLKDFELKERLSDADQSVLDDIKSSNSISLHVRRGDYVKSKETNKFHGLKGLDYYRDALKYINSKVRESKVFVFSDDIEWCKKNLTKLHQNLYFVDGERKGCIDMFLMQNCDNNIIANSSFSWWAAWLNDNPKKIIVAPKIWFNDSSVDTSDVVPSSWLKL